MARDKIQAISDRVKSLTKGKTEKVKKPPRGKNGGKRPGSGRKPYEQNIIARGVKAYVDQHANEEIKVEIKDPKTGQTRIVDKPRAIVLLEVLFEKAHIEKEVSAIREWFDRAIGKSAQPIRGDGDNDTPVKIEVDITKILAKAYDNDQG